MKISVNNSMVSVDNDSLCSSVLMFNYQNSAACNAPSVPTTLSSAAGSPTVNMTTSTTSHFQQMSSKTASSTATHTVDMPLSTTLHAFPKHLHTSSRAASSTAAQNIQNTTFFYFSFTDNITGNKTSYPKHNLNSSHVL